MKPCASCASLIAGELELCPRCGDIADVRPGWSRIVGRDDRLAALRVKRDRSAASGPAERPDA